MKQDFTKRLLVKGMTITLFAGLFLLFFSTTVNAQLGIYSFTGTGSCPNQNPAVTSQPANATFSNYTNVNAGCNAVNDVFQFQGWNQSNTLDLTQYNQLTITPSAGFVLNLSSISFTQYTDEDPNSGTTSWVLRSSMDNYATDVATGTASTTIQNPTITLSGFTNTGAVTFRFYILNAKSGGTKWTNDEVTVNGTVIPLPAVPANPGSNSPQCASPGVTMSFTGSAPAGETWYWQTSPTGTNTANSTSTYTVSTAGTYYVRAQDNTTLLWSDGAGSVTITINPIVGIPVFAAGTTSTRCQGAGTVTYSATAANNTSLVYSLDAASITGGNTINAATGAVTFDAAWIGSSTITCTATGCNGPTTSIHTVTITPTVGTPVFTLGSTSTRCQGAGTVTYDATASNTTGITYTLNAASITGGNSINAATGAVTYVAGWSGTSIITATAAGCNGPQTATHTVTINPTVGTPVFTLGASSTRCQGAGTVTYTATATNSKVMLTTRALEAIDGEDGSRITRRIAFLRSATRIFSDASISSGKF